jgi:hypothetical protein
VPARSGVSIVLQPPHESARFERLSGDSELPARNLHVTSDSLGSCSDVGQDHTFLDGSVSYMQIDLDPAGHHNVAIFRGRNWCSASAALLCQERRQGEVGHTWPAPRAVADRISSVRYAAQADTAGSLRPIGPTWLIVDMALPEEDRRPGCSSGRVNDQGATYSGPRRTCARCAGSLQSGYGHRPQTAQARAS